MGAELPAPIAASDVAFPAAIASSVVPPAARAAAIACWGLGFRVRFVVSISYACGSAIKVIKLVSCVEVSFLRL